MKKSKRNFENIKKRPYDNIIFGKSETNEIKLFGITHYRYEDCPLLRLVKLGNGMRLRDDCAAAFNEMRVEAKKEGLRLNVVSGYRSSRYQIQVFKSKFKDLEGNRIYPTDEQMKLRLKYSAPSGYSEHHTGLAVDINDTEDRFKYTKEYEWLKANAVRFGFELSFPENNSQGLGYEPWHWRYIGKNFENEGIFHQARINDSRFFKNGTC